MIVGHYNGVVVTSETLAVIRKKIMPAASGKSSAVHVDHHRAFMGGVDLGCPKIEAQAVLARNRGERTAMQHECIFVGVRQVFPVSIEVSGVLARTDAAILQRIANSRPRFWLGGWHEAIRARGRCAIGYALENVNAVPLESSNLSRSSFCDSCSVGSNHHTASATTSY